MLDIESPAVITDGRLFTWQGHELGIDDYLAYEQAEMDRYINKGGALSNEYPARPRSILGQIALSPDLRLSRFDILFRTGYARLRDSNGELDQTLAVLVDHAWLERHYDPAQPMRGGEITYPLTDKALRFTQLFRDMVTYSLYGWL